MKKSWTCANQTACKEDFERGHACLSEEEAATKWEVRELRGFVERVSRWRSEEWTSDGCSTDGELWDEIENKASDLLLRILGSR